MVLEMEGGEVEKWGGCEIMWGEVIRKLEDVEEGRKDEGREGMMS